ncbi:PREDICTED: uncharacterized protein LOC108564278 [Nicrophorus vespilloides]|uniref:Uncharacterized protein LOC108564278 n=1 Tax=Nicrophorus vespilloides TaxID=110193 RepID=A0ABM1MW17_NICVS|nr:PREDICTED: uncharacterized protein LOC108564278 [Nicrophorus vespilloides]
MSSTLKRVKSLLLPKSSPTSDDDLQPEIGFKITHNDANNELIVKVLSARNLPSSFGNIKPQGYLIKVKVFPGREKYETEVCKGSWPCYNKEFKFPLNSSFSGKFLTLTAYANLTQEEKKPKLISRASFKEHIEAFVGDKDDTQMRKSVKRSQSNRFSLNNRRLIGAASYNLEYKNFTLNGKSGRATPDIWRKLENITSGVQTERKEGRNGSIEVTMSYSNSEDGKNDSIMVSLNKLRCSMQTMQEHEKLGGNLYIKMEVYEFDVLIAKWKSDEFPPTISMKIESKTATMHATVNNYNLDRIKITIRLKCKNKINKKAKLGEIVIDNQSYMWKNVLESPSVPSTLMMNFE